MNKVVNFLKTIADKNRLSILFLLKDRELCVCELMQIIPLTQGALSIQLKNLANINLLVSRKEGKWVFYKLANDIDVSYKNILNQLFLEMTNNKDDPFIEILKDTKIKEQICKN
ncbi:ArsR/SmtB family transcription factor [Francisella philomiragia]|uniref:Bacterial regulatory, arsR family protein n=1 Tax=Francisella philomiragia TaxID=28110 RepID=A0A0B6CS04_9GAMM|nr:metalloregulator ArsR/SmtB family transcription factor [Francisella philomiragia]AJI53259.1 bacterial regulatory, arsR family protein [Francisella philomiragia]